MIIKMTELKSNIFDIRWMFSIGSKIIIIEKLFQKRYFLHVLVLKLALKTKDGVY